MILRALEMGVSNPPGGHGAHIRHTRMLVESAPHLFERLGLPARLNLSPGEP